MRRIRKKSSGTGAVFRAVRAGTVAASVAIVAACGVVVAAPASAAVGTAPAVVVTPANASLVFTGRPTIGGYTSPSASVTVNVDGVRYCLTTADKFGNWSCVSKAGVKELTFGNHAVETKSGPFTATSAFWHIDPKSVTPMAITSPEQLGTTGVPFLTGTGMADAVVTVKGFSSGEAWGETVVGPDGTWSLKLPGLSETVVNAVVVTYSFGGGVVSTSEPFLFYYKPVSAPVVEAAAVTVTGPAADATIPDARPTFSGTGEPGASIVVTDTGGARLAATTVGVDGRWTAASDADLPNGYVSATVTQTSAGDAVSAASVAFTVAVPELEQAAVTPHVVSAPAIGAVVDTRTPLYAGTGHGGAQIEVKGSSGRVLGSTVVGDDGSWSVPSGIELADGAYVGTVVQTVGGASTSVAVSYTVAAAPVLPVLPIAPFSVTSPALNEVVSMSVPVFTGVGLPGAAVEVRGSSGRLMAATTVDAGGAWSATSTLTLAPGRYLATVAHRLDGVTAHAALDYHVGTGFAVTSPVQGAAAEAPRPVYTGVSQPGATVAIVGSTGRVVATAVAGADGAWTAEALFDLHPGRYLGVAVERVNGAELSRVPVDYLVI